MLPPVEVQYRDLLHPIKDPEKSFAVNISDLLQSYITNFVQGKVPPNFNSAALLLQGSSSIYGKKVEYLHNLATQLYQSLVKNKKNDPSKKDPKEKEKVTKEQKTSDPFCSTEIKVGKNLSCLRRKALVKNATNKKSQKKSMGKKFTFVPVDLLPLEGEEKGYVFFDVLGDAVGNKGDYTINKCRVTTSGWLLLPTVSPDIILNLPLFSDYTQESDDPIGENCEPSNDVDREMLPSSAPDEGYPASSGCPSSPVSNPGSQVPLSQQTDEGISSLGSTPCGSVGRELLMEVDENSDAGAEGIENIPLESAPEDPSSQRPVRRSMRQALQVCQLEQEADGTAEKLLESQPKEKNLKKAIEKKNTCILPSKLKRRDEDNSSIYPASVFCARTFFSLDQKYLKYSGMLKFEVSAFGKKQELIQKITRIREAISRAKSKKKKSDLQVEVDEDEDVDVDGLEILKEFEEKGNELLHVPLEDGDIVIDNKSLPTMPDFDENPIAEDDLPLDVMGIDCPPTLPEMNTEEDFRRIAEEQVAMFRDDINNFVQTSDISEKVHEWERAVKPFLENLDKREAFDINLYGSRILNAFEDSNRKQTMTFRNFCKKKEKWEIHRYFMALLPLVNIGNVNIESEARSDGDEDILVTLLSRKMHHKELEEFGHNEGEH